MSTGNSSLISAGFSQGIDHFGSFHRKSLILVSKPSRAATELPSLMWRNSAKQAVCRARACCLTPQSSSRGFSRRGFLGKVAERNFHSEAKPRPFELAFGAVRSPGEEDGRLGNRIRFGIAFCAKAYASVAEAVSSPTDVEEDGRFGEELLQEVRKEEEEECEARLGGRRRPWVFGMSKNKYGVLRKRQVRAETEAWEKATKEYRELLREMCRQKLAPNLPYMKSLFLGWFEPFRDAIEKEQEMCRKRKNAALAPFLLQLPAEMMAVITMHKLVGLLMSREEHGTTRVVAAALMVGEAVEQEGKIQRFLEKSRNKSKGYGKGNGEPDTKLEEMLKKKVTDLMKQQKLQAVRQIVSAQDSSKPWGNAVKAKVGSRLIELLIETAYVQPPPAHRLADDPPDIRPAFVHTIRISTKDAKKFAKRFGIIQCDPLVVKGLDKIANHMVIPYMPMLVPPVNWTGYNKGGYFFLPSYVMRTHGVRQQREAVKRAPRNQLKPVFEALDSLGNIRWRVNKRVLTVVERIWSNGGGIVDLVDRNDVPLPEKPDTEDETLLKKWRQELRSVRKENRERYSQRCDIELKLVMARKMKDEEGFYYPHNVDFRGRAYPMPPYLNHLGSDLCRGILEFAEGRPLGNSGLHWLKIHLANVYATGGVDKLSHEGRVAFTENHLDEIFDSADKPLDGKCWWLNAEDPFQCLAACINLTDALRSSSPEKFISHIHIHQDGSCNGLQHYAALGRDKLGAVAVNLVAGDKPADVYSGIAERVLEIIRRDAQEDPKVSPDALRAKLLVNQVDRKLVKQTVMTSVYGVTFIGARDQIRKRLKERGADLSEQELFECSCYAAKITLTALGQMFEAARSIMSWLGECAKIIASQNEPVKWTTPLGLPVVQPYRKLGKRLIKTSLQILTIKRETEKILVRRQRTAFPPNFVHSLDSSHMMMTAVACRKAGITFAGVHDSYWTHACYVDEMNKILREKFVELYQTPILENLLESFEQSFPELNFPPLPERGDLDLKNVLESTYFFN